MIQDFFNVRRHPKLLVIEQSTLAEIQHSPDKGIEVFFRNLYNKKIERYFHYKSLTILIKLYLLVDIHKSE